MTTAVLLISLSVIGLLISGYISLAYLKNKKVVCPINSESCNSVLESDWSNLLGVKNEFIGIAYYLFLIVGTILINSGYTSLIIIAKTASTLSVLFSVFLVMVQARILKQFCSWCILSAIINVVIFILLVR